MHNPRVSVIMGIYNCAPYLQEALDSLYAQTFQDFEIILCDDGSTDDTYNLAFENSKEHPNIVLLRNEKNMGLNVTLNRCLVVAKGEYIARMDGDDVCSTDRFEKQLKFLEEHPKLALVSCPMYMFDENGIWGQTHSIPFPTREDVLAHAPCFTHAAVIMRADVYREVGGYTVSDYLLRVEDCHLWLKVYAAGYKGGNLQEPLYGMRDDRNAQSRRTLQARRNYIYMMLCGYRMLDRPWYSYSKLLYRSFIEIIKFVIPKNMYRYIHRKRFARK